MINVFDPKNFLKNPHAKILTFAPFELGDTVMATGLYQALRLQFPKAHITLLSQRIPHPVLEGLNIFNEIIPYERRIDLKNEYDLVLLPAFCGKAEVFNSLKNLENCLTIDQLLEKKRRGLKEKLTGAHSHLLFYKHQVELNAELISYLGYKSKIPPLYCPHEDPNLFSRWKGHTGLLIKTPFDSISASLNRFWPKGNWLELIKKLKERKLLLIGSSEDYEYLKLISEESKTPFEIMSTVGQLTALCRNLNLMITTDGGGMHMASTVGVPMIALFGKISPVLLHPWTHPEAARVVILSPNACSPCDRSFLLRLKTAGFSPMTCMSNITPEKVFETVLKMETFSKREVSILQGDMFYSKSQYIKSLKRRSLRFLTYNASRILLWLKPIWLLLGKGHSQNAPMDKEKEAVINAR